MASVTRVSPRGHESDEHLTPKNSQWVATTTRRALLATLWLAAAGAVTELTGLNDRIGRAIGNRPAFLRESISSFWDTSFIDAHRQKNQAYYQSKDISETADIQKLSQSLTNLDVLVQLFSEGKLSENDMLAHVLGGSERIVTEPGVFLVQTVSENGTIVWDVGSHQLSHGEVVTTGFLRNLLDDANNPETKRYHLTIAPRPQGGGYIFSFEYGENAYSIDAAFRLN